MIDYCQVGNGLSSRCGGGQFGDSMPPHFLMSSLSDIFRQISIDYSKNLIYTDFRTLVRYRLSWKGKSVLSENEKELIRMIRENDNPGQALNAAVVIVLGYLRQLESSGEQAAVDLQALG